MRNNKKKKKEDENIILYEMFYKKKRVSVGRHSTAYTNSYELMIERRQRRLQYEYIPVYI